MVSDMNSGVVSVAAPVVIENLICNMSSLNPKSWYPTLVAPTVAKSQVFSSVHPADVSLLARQEKKWKQRA